MRKAQARQGTTPTVELLYFGGCPNWIVAHERVMEALRLTDHADATVQLTDIATAGEDKVEQFRGSPTILINGSDPFPACTTAPDGLSCRVYATPGGPSGSPMLEELVSALT